MQIFTFIILALLFFVLSPNVLLRLPPNGNKFVVAGVHAVIFAALWLLIAKWVSHFAVSNGLASHHESFSSYSDGNSHAEGAVGAKKQPMKKPMPPVRPAMKR